ncbi:hypothetical protein LOY42_13740 [Pseudomonas sp. B21-023]|nr:hypothetical protein [Pseudomonas sp. B21-023]UVM14368.1 hypothetical protein LOY42_13740 [Pseudomonas sp. B21-023]
MLVSELPGAKYPLLALFPFRWYETSHWIIRALRLHPSGELKWMHYGVEHNGHARAQTFSSYEEGRKHVAEFNAEVSARVDELDLDNDLRISITLKAEKELTAQRRLADEERLMLSEALRRNAHLDRPRAEDLVLSPELENLREDLHEQLQESPYLRIAHIPRWGMALVRSGEHDWSTRLKPTKKCFVSCAREKIARGFGLSGTDHWGKTKAAIRSMLLPLANQLLQLASVQKILMEARARGQRVVVMGGFVFWYEENGTPGWVIKTTGGESGSENGQTLWHEGTIISKNHGRIVVLPYIKENGEKVQGHTKNASHDGKALPRHRDEYVELPFEILDGDLMIGLFGELHYERPAPGQ